MKRRALDLMQSVGDAVHEIMWGVLVTVVMVFIIAVILVAWLWT